MIVFRISNKNKNLKLYSNYSKQYGTVIFFYINCDPYHRKETFVVGR